MSNPIVLDFGSQNCRAGYAGDETPRCIFNSQVGVPRKNSKLAPGNYVGEILIEKKREFSIQNPIKNGYIEDIEGFTSLLDHAVTSLNAQESPILFTEPAMNPRPFREKEIQVMFEKFKTPCVYFQIQPLLSLFAAEMTDGLVVDSGAQVTQIIPIYEGYVLSNYVTKQYVAGNDLLEYLITTLAENREVNLTTAAAKQFVETHVKPDCLIAQDVEELYHLMEDPELTRNYTLPDGTEFSVEEERVLCPEVLFRPEMFISDDILAKGIDQAVYDTVMKCDIDVRRPMFENILVCGGNTMFKGFCERLKSGVQSLVNDSIDVNVIGQDDRLYSSWIGGSIFGSFMPFDQLAISREEYDEFGASIINERCKISWN